MCLSYNRIRPLTLQLQVQLHCLGTIQSHHWAALGTCQGQRTAQQYCTLCSLNSCSLQFLQLKTKHHTIWDNALKFVKLLKIYYIHRKLPCKPKFPIGPISRFLFHSFCFDGVEVMSATYVCLHRPVEIWQREPTVFRSSGHWQMMSPANIVHVPPFWQGFSSHSSNTAWIITIMFILTKHFGVGLHSQSLCIPVSNTAQSYLLNKTLRYRRTGFNCLL